MKMDISEMIRQTALSLAQGGTGNIKHPNPENAVRLMELTRIVIFAHHYLGCCSQIAVEQKVKELFRLMEAESTTEIATDFIRALPEIRRVLNTDIEAIYKGDPAAEDYSEIVFCYPAVTALLHHRVANLLYKHGVPILPRLISELAHSATGIDIHPGAEIGEYFSIDHGTGTVIGQTTVIGNSVRIYQGVTLGARSFRSDENGDLINEPRHPIIEDNVVIYSNTSVLGRITIGHDSVIGGNVWLTENVAPCSKISQSSVNVIK